MTSLLVKPVICFLMLITYAAAGGTEPAQKNNADNVSASFRSTRAQVLQTSLSPIPAGKPTDPKLNLDGMIARLQSMDIPAGPIAPAVLSKSPNSVEQFEKQVPKADVHSPAKEKLHTHDPNLICAEVTEIIASASGVIDVFNIAEALFKSGKLIPAAKYYRMALAGTTEKDNASDRAWLTFQAANCLRRSQPDAAYDLYRQLITEYPQSDYTAAAVVQQKLIDWQRQSQLLKILEKYNVDPNSF